MRSSRYIVYDDDDGVRWEWEGGHKGTEGTLERKSMPIVAWYVLSKVSYMKRVISDVLPTGDG